MAKQDQESIPVAKPVEDGSDQASVVKSLISSLSSASVEQRLAFGRLLGIRSPSIAPPPKPKLTNAQVKHFVTAHGDVIHSEGWEVLPPTSVSEKGPAATAEWYQHRYTTGQTMNSRDVADLDALADQAEQAEVDMGARIEAGDFKNLFEGS